MRRLPCWAVAALAAPFAVAGCNPQPPAPTVTDPAPTVTVAGPTVTASAPTTASSSAARPTTTSARPSASATTPGTPSGTRTPTRYEVPPMPGLYYVKLDDGGPLGCGDSLQAGMMAPVLTDDHVREAMTKLLADHDPTFQNLGALTNSLAASQLSYVKGKVDKAAQRVDVWLSGKLVPSGTCDAPRLKGQLELTAVSAAQVPLVMIWIDDVPLDTALDQRG